MEKRDDDERKKDKRFIKKGKKGKAKGKTDASPAASRTAISTSTLHTSVQESSEEEEEEEEDDREQNGSGDFATYSRKKGDLKSPSSGQLPQFHADFIRFEHL